MNPQSPKISINKRAVGQAYSPYIVAEMSANHGGSIDNALSILRAAKESGADAIKIQSYSADRLTLNSKNEEFLIKKGLWAGRTLYDLYKEGQMPREWHSQLFDYAREIGITIFSSPFDAESVDLLETLNTPAYKIASFEIIDLPLIKYVAQTGKPIIISTGMAGLQEIEEAISVAKQFGSGELAVLHCVSGYPAKPSEYNLQTLVDMRDRFGLVTGLSDHTISNTTAIASIPLGASIIEKHFTLTREKATVDDQFSIEPNELKELCLNSKIAWESLGVIDYELKESEVDNVQFRRSLYFVEDLKAGAPITLQSIRSIRPGNGLAPKYFEELIGKIVLKNVKKGEPVTWSKIREC
jgi:N-acetylneuraminate synthase